MNEWSSAFGRPFAINPEPTYCGLPFVTPRGVSEQGKFVNQNTSHGEEKVPYSDQTSTQEQGSWQRKIKEGSWTQCPKCPHWNALETPQKKRLCWAFNLPNGCSAAKPGETCSKGLHVCAEPGCFKHHSLQQHR